MFNKWRRKIAGFLAVTMIAGQLAQGQTSVAYAAPSLDYATPSEDSVFATPSETDPTATSSEFATPSELFNGDTVIVEIEASQIRAALRSEKELDKDKIPFEGDGKEGVYRALRDALKGRSIVVQERLSGEDDSVMYLVAVTDDGGEENLADRLDLIVVNANREKEYTFFVRLADESVSPQEGKVTRYEVSYEEPSEIEEDGEETVAGAVTVTRHEAPLVTAPAEDGEIGEEPDDNYPGDVTGEAEDMETEEELPDFFEKTGTVESTGDEEIITEVNLTKSDEEDLAEDDIKALSGDETSGDEYAIYTEDDAGFFARLLSSGNTRRIVGYPMAAGRGITVLSVRTAKYEDVFGYADQLFGDSETSAGIANVTVSADRSGEIEAGETFQISILYSPKSAPLWEEEGKQPVEMYSGITNPTVTLKLPKGIALRESSNVTLDDKTADYRLYTVHLDDITNLSTNRRIELTAYMENNGAAEIGEKFFFDVTDTTFSGTITVSDGNRSKDYTVEKPVTVGNKYIYTLTSDDSWGIEKELIQQGGRDYEIIDTDEDGVNDQVKVTYEIRTGLLAGDSITGDDSAYINKGRVPFESFSISDVPLADDGSIKPESVEVWQIGENGQETELTVNTDEDGSFTITTYNTKGGQGSDVEGQFEVDNGAPYYTRYRVEVTYPYDPFEVDFWDEAATDPDKFWIENTATLSYTLKGGDPQTDSAEDGTKVKVIRESADLTIKKLIQVQNLDGGWTSVPYDAEMADQFEEYASFGGYAQFQIEHQVNGTWVGYEDGFLVSTGEDGKDVIEPLGSSYVYINPAGDSEDGDVEVSGTDGSVKIRLLAGTYRITEVKGPEGTSLPTEDDEKTQQITLTVGDSGEVTFINTSSGVGRIAFTKTDGTGKGLEGAVFGVWEGDVASGDPMMTATSDEDGAVSFYPLLAEDGGTVYTVQEITAPEGYILDEQSYQVTVQGGETVSVNAEKSISNRKNEGSLTLTKMVKASAGANDSVSTYKPISDYENTLEDFPTGTFTIQQRTEGGEWEDYSAGLSLGSDGKLTASGLPVYVLDEDGNITGTYEYRVVETVPGTYSAVTIDGVQDYDPTAGTVATEGITLSGESNTIVSGTLSIYNIPTGMLNLHKYQVAVDAATGDSDSTNAVNKTFQLYRELNDGTFQRVSVPSGTGSKNAWETKQDGTVNLTGLPVWDENGDLIQYYWYETPASQNGADLYGYRQSTSDFGDTGKVDPETVPVDNVEGADEGTAGTMEMYGPFSAAASLDGSSAPTLYVYNVEQKYPIWVEKLDSVTGDDVADTKFTVYDITDVEDDENQWTIVGSENSITGNQSGAVLLDTGKVYAIKETSTPGGYYGFETADGKGYLVVDLSKTDVAPTMEVTKETPFTSRGGVASGHKVTFENQPMPKLSVKKTLYETGNGGSASGSSYKAVFDLYQLQDGEYVKVTSPGTITANSAAVSLPAGTYYLKEQMADGLVDPILYLANGDSCGEATVVVEKDGSVYYEVTLRDQTPTDSQSLWTAEIANYKNLGSVTGTKNDGWTGKELAGATFTIYRVDSETETQVKTVTSGSNGAFTVKDLPIYDGDGDLITYRIRETGAPSGYVLNGDTSYDFTLSKDKVTATATNGAYIVFENNPQISLTTTKYSRDQWDSQFQEILYELPGVQLALFHKVGDNYVPVTDAAGNPLVEVTSEQWGHVTFTGLDPNDAYYVVEVYQAVDSDGVPFDMDGKSPVLEGGNDTPVEETKNALKDKTFTEDGFAEFYFAEFDGTAISEEDKADGTRTYTTEDLINDKGWVQFTVNKTSTESAQSISEEEYNDLPENEKFSVEIDGVTHYYQITGQIEKEQPNGARFELYSADLDTYRQSGGTYFITKPDLDGEENGLTYLGTYESGTITDSEGNIIDGELRTDIFHDVSKVYWLVEVKAPIGYTLDPEKSTVAFVPDTLDENEVRYDDHFQHVTYGGNDNQPSIEVPNYKLTGDGVLYQGALKLSKWLATEENGITAYKALGNVKFELSIEGYEDFVLDELTTGLENNGSVSENPDNPKTGYAVSRYFEYEEVRGQFVEYLETVKGLSAEEAEAEANQIFQAGEDADRSGAPDYYTISCILREVDAPAKVVMDQTAHEVTLKLLDTSLAEDSEDYINKEYFTTDTTEFPDAESALINYLSNYYQVTVHKYGYELTDELLAAEPTDLTLDEMGGQVEKASLNGVKFKLEAYDYTDGQWKPYAITANPDEAGTQNGADHTKGEFITYNGGTYTFQNGLPRGRYRLSEISLGEDYEDEYFNVYSGGRYRYFTVDNSQVTVNVYNPSLLSLTVEKTLLDGSKPGDLSDFDGITFKLAGPTTGEAAIAGGSGKVTFTGLEPGSYTLTETTADTAGNTTNVYTEPQSFTIGYGCEQDGDVAVIRKTAGALDSIETPVVSVANPRVGALQITKEDGQGNPLEGVTFTYSWAKFREEDFGSDGNLKSLDELEKVFDSALAGLSYTGKGTLTTGKDGTASVSGLVPGWYRIQESESEGIDGDYTVNTAAHYVAVTGDMAKKDSGDTGNFYQNADDPATEIIYNYQKVTVNLEKSLAYGSLDRDEMGGDQVPVSVTYRIYAGTAPGSAKEIASYKFDTGELSDGTAEAALETKLDQLIAGNGNTGTNYYLEEAVEVSNDSQANWVMESGTVRTGSGASQSLTTAATKKSGNYITSGKVLISGEGRFDSSEDVTISLTNRPAMGQIVVKKTDGSTGEALEGAKFAVYGNENCTGTPLATGITGDDGTCMLNVWLNTTSVDGEQTVWVKETEAPAYYVQDETAVAVALSAGEVVRWDDDPQTYDLTFENTPGMEIELVKYADTYENLYKDGAFDDNQLQLTDAVFDLYVRDAGSADPWVKVSTEEVTDGRISWTGLVSAGKEYAIYEHEIEDGDYENYELNSVHTVGTDGRPTGTELSHSLQETKESAEAEETVERELYILGSSLTASSTHVFAAFNKPAVEIEIRKYGLENDQSTGNAPTARFEIADITGMENLDINDPEQTKDLPAVATVTTEGSRRDGDGNWYSWATVQLKEGTYLITEVEALTDGYSIVKNDSRVQWHKVANVSENGTKIYDFTNVKTEQSLGISKEVVGDTPLANLWWTRQQMVTFRITPTVQNDVPLKSFVIEDPGLTMQNEAGENLTDESYWKNQYTLDSLKIAVPTASNKYISDEKGEEYFPEATPAEISAEVTLIDFDRKPIGEPITLAGEDGEDGFWTVNVSDFVPAGQRVAKFTISYTDKALMAASQIYSLGRDFDPGTVEASFILYQQPAKESDGTTDSEQIKKVVNEAKAEMFFNEYDSLGAVTESGSGVKDAAGEVTVSDPQVPTVQVSKAVAFADGTSAADEYVESGESLTYTLTLTNVSSDVEVPMQAPVMLDILPEGMEVDRESITAVVPENSDLELNSGRVVVRGRYLYLPFTGNLEKGEAIRVSFCVTVQNAIINNPSPIVNNVYVTSAVQQEAFAGNEGGATFKNNNGWPAILPEVEAVIGEIDGTMSGHGWFRAYVNILYQNSGSIELLKEARGDLDTDYSSVNESSKASLDDGTVWYRLTAINNGDEAVSGLSVVDKLPDRGDSDIEGNSRLSNWALQVQELTAEDRVKILKYDSKALEGTDISNQVQIYYGTDGRYRREDLLGSDYMNGWSGDYSEAGAADSIKAVMFDFDDSVTLEPGGRLVIEFETVVEELTQEEQETGSLAYANNDFMLRAELNQTPFVSGSNKVSTFLVPGLVKVGGKVWIDANNNGIQDDNETYLSDEVHDLWEKGYFQIALQESGEQPRTLIYGEDLTDNRFEFEGLIPSRPLRDDQENLYTHNGDALIKYSLDTSQLRGENPESYQLFITVDEEKGGDGIIWRLAKTAQMKDGTPNPDSGKSRKPDSTDLYSDDASAKAENLDSNFVESDDTYDYESERFFLWNTGNKNEWDHTKDLGLVPYRSVSLTKEDGAGNGIEGAEFAIYGPFATASEITVSEDKLVVRGETDAGGSLNEIPELLYYQTYLLVEENPADGYTTYGATAGLTEWTGELQENAKAWIIPNMHDVADEDKADINDITVINQYDAGSLTFRKTDEVTGDDLAGAQFELSWSYEENGANQGISQKNAESMWIDYLKKATAGTSDPENGALKEMTGVRKDSLKATPAQSGAFGAETKLTFVTDGSGAVKLPGLPYGSYTLKEVRAPEGYSQLLDGDAFERSFTIEAEDKDVEAEQPIVNERQPYNLTLQKQTDYGTLVPGITFKIEGPGTYSKDGIFNLFGLLGAFRTGDDAAEGTVTTDQTGKAMFEGLGFGDYKITEVTESAYEEIEPIYISIGKDGIVTILKDNGAVKLNNNAQSTEEAPVINLIITNTPKTGDLELEKVDSENTSKKLSGAEFLLTGTSDADGAWAAYVEAAAEEDYEGIVILNKNKETPGISFCLTGTETSGKTDGKGAFRGLPYGEYTLTETKAPDGYVLGETPWSETFTIGEESETISFTDGRTFFGLLGEDLSIGNRMNTLTVEKVSSIDSHRKLSGAVFILRQAAEGGSYVLLENGIYAGLTDDRNQAGKITTGADGTAEVRGLPAGSYKLMEVTAPAGYEVTSDIPGVAMGDKDQAVTVSDNYSTGSFTVAKKDKTSDRLLEGAVFELHWANDPESGIDAEAGAGMWADYLERVLSENPATPAEMRGVKPESVKATSEAPYTADTRLQFETNGETMVSLDGLPFGTYQLKEVKAPEGYESPFADLDQSQRSFTIGAEEGSREITLETIYNERHPYQLILQKQTDYGTPVSGITFTVEGPGEYDEERATLSELPGMTVLTGTTGEEGVLVLDQMPFGDYRITEQISSIYEELESFYVRIHEDGEVELLTNAGGAAVLTDKDQAGEETDVINITVTNIPRTGELALEKVDSRNSEKKLAGAEFLLSGTSDAAGALADYAAHLATPSDMEGIEVISVDVEDETVNISFRLTGTADGQGVTDGKGAFHGLPYGHYTLTETKAPDGYVLGEEPWTSTFDINLEHPLQSFTDGRRFFNLLGTDNSIPNDMQELTIVKASAINEDRGLAGAEFILRAESGEYVVLDQDGIFAGFTASEEEATRITTDGDGKAVVKGLLTGTYSLIELTAPDGYLVNTEIPDFEVVSEHQTITVTDDYATGTFTVEKRDAADNALLAGVTFELSWSNDRESGIAEDDGAEMWADYLTKVLADEATPSELQGVRKDSLTATPSEMPYGENTSLVFETDGTAAVYLPGLPFGDYVLKEVGAPVGYSQLFEDGNGTFERTFTIGAENTEIGAETIFNERYPYRLTLRKVTDYGTPIQNMPFTVEGPGIYSERIFSFLDPFHTTEDTSRGVFLTDEDGRLNITGLGFGDYRITEQTNDVYEEIESFYVRIHEDGRVELLTDAKGAVRLESEAQSTDGEFVLNLTVENKVREGSVTVEKVDSDDHSRRLTGAEFRLTGESAAEGAFEEYVKNITGEGIEVVDKKNGENPEFTFRITGSDTLLGGTDGTGVLTGLPFGSYTLTETKAPDGYVLDETPWSRDFTLDVENDQIQFTDKLLGEDAAVENRKHELTVTKVSSVNEDRKLAGAEFIIRAADGRYVVLENGAFAGWSDTEDGATSFVTDENGNAVVRGLPQGTYTLLEVKSPAGYYINRSIPSFEVGDQHQIVVVEDRPRGNDGGGSGPSGGGGNPGGGSGGPGAGIEITAPEIPLAPLPGESIVAPIPEEEVPLARLPKTGDISKDHGLMALITAALAVFLVITGRKKEEEEK